MLGRRAVLLPAVVLAVVAGCTGHDPYRPGESIGVFHVSGRLLSTTCGQTPDPWEFDVRLRHDTTTLFWVQGDAPISGQVDPTARVLLKSSTVQTVRAADDKTRTAACMMARNDVVDLVLAPMAAPSRDVGAATSFKGTLSYRFTATDGSSCEDQLTESGGDFATLPCDVQYDLTGTRTGDAK
jgi:hypothetical protein